MPYVITNRNTLLKTDVLGFQRAIHQQYSTDLASLDIVYFPYMKSHLQGTEDLIIELRPVM